MDFLFNSQEELYKRVRPALHAKEIELHRLGFLSINSSDIWKYLIKTKWKSAKGLMLSDIVSDILNLDNRKIDAFCREEIKKENIQVDREIL